MTPPPNKEDRKVVESEELKNWLNKVSTWLKENQKSLDPNSQVHKQQLKHVLSERI
jgi:hypothetical protein